MSSTKWWFFKDILCVNDSVAPLGWCCWQNNEACWASATGKCLEFLFTVFRHFPSLVHSSAASCRKSRAERGISVSFSKSNLCRFQFGRTPKDGGGGGGSLQLESEQGPSSGWLWFNGHVLTVQNSHEECLLKCSWRLNHSKYLKYLRLWTFSLTVSGDDKYIHTTFTLQEWLFKTVFRFFFKYLSYFWQEARTMVFAGVSLCENPRTIFNTIFLGT